MPISGTTSYSATRDQIITRALRIIGAIGQGETPTTTALTEASQALNDIVKEWEADGMQLWKYLPSAAIPYTATVNQYQIGTGATINQVAPLKIVQAFNRNILTNYDQPMLVITNQEYMMLGNKASPGTPNQLHYTPPGPLTTGQQVGTIIVYPTPDANAVATVQLFVVSIFPLDDFDAGTDLTDFPSFYYNALVWGLADQLSYEYGVPYQQQSMIANKATLHLQKALAFDIEEGSLFIQPNWQYGAGS